MTILQKSALVCAIAIALFPVSNVFAQQTETMVTQQNIGIVRGRVLNTTTGEYLRNAQVRVEGTSLSVYTDDGGNFRLIGVPSGDAVLLVRYSGLEEATETINVSANQSTVQNFELKAPSYGNTEMYELTVTAARGGIASALAEQRAALNAKSVVPADNYGALTMGDVGEFMKSMPGLSLDYTEVDATQVRIGGLDPKYSTFTTDGARIATATSNNNTGRQNSFEQMSITGIESIEMNNTLTASMDADSPGGNINLRSKYAFQRTERDVIFQVGAVGTSDSSSYKIYLPDDKEHRTIYPSLQLGYGDVFMDSRLGVEFNISHNANYVQQDRLQVDWSYKDDGRSIPYRVMFRPGPKLTSRTGANLSLDYKITDELIFSWRSNYSFYDVEYFNQYTYLNFGSNNSDPATSYTTPDSTGTSIVVNPNGANTNLSTGYSHRYARTPAWSIAPKLDFQGESIELAFRPFYSTSKFEFIDNDEGFFQRTDTRLNDLGFTLERPSESSTEFLISQTAGPDWSNATNWVDNTGYNIRNNENQSENEQYGAYIDLKKHFTFLNMPATVLGGIASRNNEYAANTGNHQQYRFVGPSGNQSEAIVPSNQNYDFEFIGMDVGNFNDLNWRSDSNYATYDLFVSNPEYFQADTVGNLQRMLSSHTDVDERVDAAYVEFQGNAGNARYDLGVRYEKTSTDALVIEPRSESEMIAAGYPVSSSGVPTTADGMLYYYRNGQKGSRSNSYDDFFLSGGLKYDFTDQLVGQLSFSESILRPDYANLGGTVSINEDNQTVTTPNTQLKPERSTKYFAGLNYYFEPAGTVGASYYRLDMKDMQVTGIEIDAVTAGFDPTAYDGWTFRSASNLPGTSTNEGMILEYNQQLTFLPNLFKGFSVNGSYTMVNPDGPRVNTPENITNWGIRYNYGSFDVRLNGTWQDNYRISGLSATPSTSNNGVLYRAEREMWNLSLGYKLNDNIEFMLAGRNIFNEPDVVYSNVSSRMQKYDQYGSMWNFSMRAQF